MRQFFKKLLYILLFIIVLPEFIMLFCYIKWGVLGLVISGLVYVVFILANTVILIYEMSEKNKKKAEEIINELYHKSQRRVLRENERMDN